MGSSPGTTIIPRSGTESLIYDEAFKMRLRPLVVVLAALRAACVGGAPAAAAPRGGAVVAAAAPACDPPRIVVDIWNDPL